MFRGNDADVAGVAVVLKDIPPGHFAPHGRWLRLEHAHDIRVVAEHQRPAPSVKNMEVALIGLAGVLIGGLLTAIAEAIRASAGFKREKAWRLREERLTRHEQLYQAIEQLRLGYAMTLTKLFAMINGMEGAEIKSPRIPWSRIRMLVELHVPEMRDDLAVVKRACDGMGKATSKLLNTDSVEQRRALLYGELQQGHKGLESACEAFSQHLVELVAKLRDETDRQAR